MPPIFLYRKNVNAVDEIIAHGLPIGAMNHSKYTVSDLSLAKGDVLLLMSDGMPELQNKHNEMYGYHRIRNSFKKVAHKKPDEIIAYLKDESSAWVKDKDPDDDVTFVVIKVK
jgi:serine phosphatase RsbU (regulator of sigma subunit)